MAFNAPIPLKRTTAERHDVNIFCTHFHADQSRNTETAGTKSCTPSSKVGNCVDILEVEARFDNTEFHENPVRL